MTVRARGVWPLSPLQEGLLFHASFDDEGPDVYTGQRVLRPGRPRGPGPAAALLAGAAGAPRRAARQLPPARRPARPCRSSPATCELPWREADLAALPEDEALARGRTAGGQERLPASTWRVPPLLRVLLVPLGPGRGTGWSSPATTSCMDGWSMPVLLGRTVQRCTRRARCRALPPVGSVPGLPGLAGRQDRAAAEEAWRQELAGARGTDPRRARRPRPAARAAGAASSATSRRGSRAGVDAPSRARRGLTVNTVVQGGVGAGGGAVVAGGTMWCSARRWRGVRPSCRVWSRWSGCSSTRCRCGCRCAASSP